MGDYFKAAQHGNLSFFQELSAAHPSSDWLARGYSKSGDTALHYAVRFGHVELVRYLHSLGADLELANFDGKKALHEAAQAGKRECLEYLIENGVKIDPLKKADWTPLMLACTKADLSIVEVLVKHGASLSLKNKDGWSCFHIACREGHVPIVDYLLQCSPGVWDTTSKNGRTPLHTAALQGCEGVVSYLLDHCGYETDARDSCGTTPLMDALRVQQIHIAEMLIHKHKADVMAEDNLHRQSLHLAAQAGCLDSVRFLVTRCRVPADSASSLTGVTALHVAAKEGHAAMIDLLLSLGVDINSRDNKGRTALHIAAGAQHASCVDTLLQQGAAQLADMTGTTPDQLARKQPVVQLFSTPASIKE